MIRGFVRSSPIGRWHLVTWVGPMTYQIVCNRSAGAWPPIVHVVVYPEGETEPVHLLDRPYGAEPRLVDYTWNDPELPDRCCRWCVGRVLADAKRVAALPR